MAFDEIRDTAGRPSKQGSVVVPTQEANHRARFGLLQSQPYDK